MFNFLILVIYWGIVYRKYYIVIIFTKRNVIYVRFLGVVLLNNFLKYKYICCGVLVFFFIVGKLIDFSFKIGWLLFIIVFLGLFL